MTGPQAYVRHLREQQYHPRSDAHSNALCLAILDDLLDHCEPFAAKAARGEIVAKLNHKVTYSYQEWTIDLAIGPPPGAPVAPERAERIVMTAPAAVEVAIEAKGVMTEHGKARRNRLRDLQAFHGHAHTYNPKTIAVGVVVVNMSPVFWSPIRGGADITEHVNIERLGAETVALYRSLPLRHGPADGAGLEAACVLVVTHDNLPAHPSYPTGTPWHHETDLITKAPAPRVGDPLHYATMIHRICTAYRDRWT